MRKSPFAVGNEEGHFERIYMFTDAPSLDDLGIDPHYRDWRQYGEMYEQLFAEWKGWTR